MIGRDLMLFPAVIALVVVAFAAIRKREGFWKTFTSLCFTSYLCALVAVTMFPIPVDPRLIADRSAAGFLSNSFVPFSTISSALSDGITYFALQVGGNLLLLVPFGLVLPILFPRFRRLRRSLEATVVAAFSIEIAQYAVSVAIGYTYRQADVDDLMLNVAGGLVGFGLYSLLSLMATRLSTRSARTRSLAHASKLTS